jgi:hypothetical protein
MYKIIFSIFFAPFFIFAAEPEVKSLNLSFDDFTVTDTSAMEKEILAEKAGEKSESGIKEKSALDEFFDKSLKVFDAFKKKGGEVINSIAPQSNFTVTETKKAPKKDVDLAKSFPDPLFYEAQYDMKSKFITYAYIYNDKTNRDNNHIPKLKNYDIYSELFSLAKASSKQSRFYELFHSLVSESTFNINEKDEFGNTLLLTAIRNGNYNVFFFLLNKDANPSICNKKNVCPLHLALYADNLILLKVLLEKNVNIRITDKDKMSPLQYAIYENKKEIFDLLLTRYLKYTPDKNERKELIEFAESLQRINYAQEMKKIF